MGGRESKSDSDCDCCSECAALHRSYPMNRSKFRLMQPQRIGREFECRNRQFYNQFGNSFFNFVNPSGNLGTEANEYDVLNESASNISQNFAEKERKVDFSSLNKLSEVELGGRSCPSPILKSEQRWLPKAVGEKGDSSHGATLHGEGHLVYSTNPNRTPWLVFTPKVHSNAWTNNTPSLAITDSTSPYLEGMSKGLLGHKCGRCTTEEDVISLFEFEKFERDCDDACKKAWPPIPKARKAKLIQEN